MSIISSLLDKIKTKGDESSDKPSQITHDDAVLAICVLMIEVSKSDDTFDDIEKDKIIDTLEHKYNLSVNQVDSLLKLADEKNEEMISLYDWTKIINDTFDYDERVNVLRTLWDVAHADNIIDKYEDYTIRKIADLIYVKHSDFIRAKLD